MVCFSLFYCFTLFIFYLPFLLIVSEAKLCDIYIYIFFFSFLFPSYLISFHFSSYLNFLLLLHLYTSFFAFDYSRFAIFLKILQTTLTTAPLCYSYFHFSLYSSLSICLIFSSITTIFFLIFSFHLSTSSTLSCPLRIFLLYQFRYHSLSIPIPLFIVSHFFLSFSHLFFFFPLPFHCMSLSGCLSLSSLFPTTGSPAPEFPILFTWLWSVVLPDLRHDMTFFRIAASLRKPFWGMRLVIESKIAFCKPKFGSYR